MKVAPYSYAIESLMYVMMRTRPDIAFPMGLVSLYQSNPRRILWLEVKRIQRYLKGTSIIDSIMKDAT